jgi:hypothetical protein
MSESIFSAFVQAIRKPLVKSVLWPDDIALDHPLRKLDFGVRYWPVGVVEWLNKQELTEDGKWKDATTHDVAMVAGLATEEGESLFASEWPAVWEAHCKDKDIEPDRDENRVIVPPPINYPIVAAWYMKTFDDAQSKTINFILWKQVMTYNGFTLTEGKN